MCVSEDDDNDERKVHSKNSGACNVCSLSNQFFARCGKSFEMFVHCGIRCRETAHSNQNNVPYVCADILKLPIMYCAWLFCICETNITALSL
jgi:hypothetical protein